jgi:hypothetical protein
LFKFARSHPQEQPHQSAPSAARKTFPPSPVQPRPLFVPPPPPGLRRTAPAEIPAASASFCAARPHGGLMREVPPASSRRWCGPRLPSLRFSTAPTTRRQLRIRPIPPPCGRPVPLALRVVGDPPRRSYLRRVGPPSGPARSAAPSPPPLSHSPPAPLVRGLLGAALAPDGSIPTPPPAISRRLQLARAPPPFEGCRLAPFLRFVRPQADVGAQAGD